VSSATVVPSSAAGKLYGAPQVNQLISRLAVKPCVEGLLDALRRLQAELVVPAKDRMPSASIAIETLRQAVKTFLSNGGCQASVIGPEASEAAGCVVARREAG